jgi:hypothetical protein
MSGVKYRAISDAVRRSQTFGGHGAIGWPKLFSTKDCSPASLRLRDSKLEAVSTGAIGAARYRCTAQLVSAKALTMHRKNRRAEFMEISLRTNENRRNDKMPKLDFSEARG